MNCIKRRYCADLDAAAKQRYDEKLDILLGLVDDPYKTPFVPCQRYLRPEIDTFSPYTKEELKAYTSLDRYNFNIQGWVSNIRILKLG